MKHLLLISLFAISIAQADIMHISPDETCCSIEQGMQCLSTGLLGITDFGTHDEQLKGVTELLNGIAAMVSTRVTRSDLSRGEKCQLCEDVNRVNDMINGLIEKSLTRSSTILRNAESEKKTILEGLKQIVSGLFSMVMSPSSIRPLLTIVFGGVLKVLSAIFADGKLDNQDLQNVKESVVDLLAGKKSEAQEGEAVFF